jgi:hypothetical protein
VIYHLVADSLPIRNATQLLIFGVDLGQNPGPGLMTIGRTAAVVDP